MHRVLMNFQCNRGWSGHFIEADCRTPVSLGHFYAYTELAQVREILVRANAAPEVFAEFDHNVRAWSRGSVYLDLTDLQYTKLKKTRRAQPRVDLVGHD
jgi:hypothetical protein